MRRFCLLTIGSVILASCRIERTPEQYIDNQASRTDAVATAETEVRNRIAALADALGRGSAAVDSVLVPREEFSAIGPDANELIVDPGTFVDRMVGLTGGGPVSTRHIEVSVAPGILYAWFMAVYAPADGDPDDPGFRVSGVLTRDNAGWRLSQGHLSRPITELPVP